MNINSEASSSSNNNNNISTSNNNSQDAGSNNNKFGDGGDGGGGGSSSNIDNTTNKDKQPERPKLPTAKWGAACAACATAKAKCIRSNDTIGAKCDRCERLLKECTSQIHRPRKKRQSKPSRTAQIEERLNGLVSLLKASGDISGGQAGAASQGGSLNDDRGTTAASSNPASPFSSPTSSLAPFPAVVNTWHIDPSYNSFTPKSCICHPESLDAPPPPGSDEVLLDIYRTTLQPVHPFVVIHPNITAAYLTARRPFLMAAIRMVSSFRSVKSMRAQMYHLMKYIADHMLIRSEKSLDLLLGIIVMLGYQQYHCCLHGQLNNLVALSVTLVAEIGLNKPPGVNERTRLMVVRPPEASGRTNEERRAFLGAWYWSSVISMNFQKIEPMRHTSYVQDCVRHLEASGEHESDLSLTYLIKLQRLTERIAELNSLDNSVEEPTPIPPAPKSAYLSVFQTELNQLMNNMPNHLREDKMFQLYLDSARLRLYEPPIIDKNLIAAISKSLSSPSMTTDSPLDKMYQSSAALNAWFSTWLSIPVQDYYFQTTAVGSHLVYALVLLGRWARLATPRTLYEGHTPMPQDASADNPNVDLYHADAQDSYDATGPSKYTEPEPRYHCRGDLDTDPDLAAAVAVLRSQIQTQPGLMINIPEILTAVCTHFEQANAQFQYCSDDADKFHRNLWMLIALKVRITRAKLERWAEFVSHGADALALESRHEGETRDWFDSLNFSHGFHDLQGMESLPDNAGQDLDVELGNTWAADLLSGTDPNAWFDGDLDWGSFIMNSMGSMEK